METQHSYTTRHSRFRRFSTVVGAVESTAKRPLSPILLSVHNATRSAATNKKKKGVTEKGGHQLDPPAPPSSLLTYEPTPQAVQRAGVTEGGRRQLDPPHPSGLLTTSTPAYSSGVTERRGTSAGLPRPPASATPVNSNQLKIVTRRKTYNLVQQQHYQEPMNACTQSSGRAGYISSSQQALLMRHR